MTKGGKYLVIEFDDTATADAVRASIDAMNGNGARLLGEFLKPDDSCICQLDVDKDGETTPYRLKLDALGWYVCTKCMKPRPYYGWLRNQIQPDQIKNVQSFLTGLPRQPREACSVYLNHLSLQPMRLHLFDAGQYDDPSTRMMRSLEKYRTK